MLKNSMVQNEPPLRSATCRHGFYYIVSLADFKRRRRGKPLRSAHFVIKQTKFGMQGRVMSFQEHPFECQSNYAGIGGMRCNLDVQDLRRVLKEDAWLDENEQLPCLGPRPEQGYMKEYEWDGEDYVLRREGNEATKWDAELSPAAWREIFLKCSSRDNAEDCDKEDDFLREMDRDIIASFSDGINTGFYINAYTTKQCPTMEGVLEQMRKGLDRLQQRRETEQQKIREELEKRGPGAEMHLTSEEKKALKGKSAFGHTMYLLKNLSASYRRCYWKSGSEMLFPILFGHMTFASHRCWTVFMKKATFLAGEAWRKRYGKGVRRAALRDGGGEVLSFLRAGMDPYPLFNWKKISLEGGQTLYEGPEGELFEDLQQAYEHTVAAKTSQTGFSESKVGLSFLQKFLNNCCSEEQEMLIDDARIMITTSTMEDIEHKI
jgi:hypothetical protein